MNSSDEQFYASVSEEMEKGEFNKALWTKAFALSGGVEAAAKSHYCRLRVEQLQATAKKLDSTARRAQANEHFKELCWGLCCFGIAMFTNLMLGIAPIDTRIIERR